MVQATEKEEKTIGQKCGDSYRSFTHFLYNSETGEVLGRSGASWAKIGLFYLVFYGFLAAFFIAMLSVFMTTVNEPGKGAPKLTQFIANKAGLNRLDRKNKLTNYKVSDNGSISSYADTINTYLKGFEAYDNGNDSIKCGDAMCKFDRSALGDCSGISDVSFGLDSRKPCIFIRVNKVFGWKPPSSGLKLDCGDGANVFPTSGFQLSAFPFEGQDGYVSPVVAVQIDATTDGAKKVDCTLTGEDIEVSDSFTESRAFGKIRIEDISSEL